MKVIRAKEFTADKAWGALDIANMRGITTRLHWTDQPYRWHTNDEDEVFVVLDGTVEMHFKQGGEVRTVVLGVGDIFYASVGTEHVAQPQGAARVLVVETQGSV
jgi:mannose-6-phosphate isomerase-like protein (cupin superfamily)